jgi:signal transduction histidine kinase
MKVSHPDAVFEETQASLHGDALLLLSQCEQQKAAIARTLHDGLAQQLTVAGIELALWQSEVNPAQPVPVEVVQRKLAILSALVTSMISTSRSLASSLRPRALDAFGLAAAMEGMVARLRGRIGGECWFEQKTDDIDLSPERAIHLIRVVDGLFSRIELPGITVTLRQQAGTVELRIVAEALPELPEEELARLRIFGGTATRRPGGIVLRFPTAQPR